ncbi:hypothetical protein HK101_004105 [Irineochytrium annulatum]|nr:hypothetical protein HK101_004105 [Irineochytrium annulatum]
MSNSKSANTAAAPATKKPAPSRTKRHNLKLSCEHKHRFMEPFNEFLEHLLSVLPLKPDATANTSQCKAMLASSLAGAPKGSDWTIWISLECRARFLERKKNYAPGSTHSEFIEFLLRFNDDLSNAAGENVMFTSSADAALATPSHPPPFPATPVPQQPTPDEVNALKEATRRAVLSHDLPRPSFNPDNSRSSSQSSSPAAGPTPPTHRTATTGQAVDATTLDTMIAQILSGPNDVPSYNAPASSKNVPTLTITTDSKRHHPYSSHSRTSSNNPNPEDKGAIDDIFYSLSLAAGGGTNNASKAKPARRGSRVRGASGEEIVLVVQEAKRETKRERSPPSYCYLHGVAHHHDEEDAMTF